MYIINQVSLKSISFIRSIYQFAFGLIFRLALSTSILVKHNTMNWCTSSELHFILQHTEYNELVN